MPAQLSHGARILVERCARVRPGEQVVIVTDFAKLDVARWVAAVAGEAGATVVLMAMAPLEDEGVYGTAHVGIGTSTLLGGEVKAPMHYDAVMWTPSHLSYANSYDALEAGMTRMARAIGGLVAAQAPPS